MDIKIFLQITYIYLTYELCVSCAILVAFVRTLLVVSDKNQLELAIPK